MITFLKGILADKQPTRVILDVGGVGYEVHIPLSSYDRLPAKFKECQILTHDYVREDTHQLFGFMTEQERTMFTLLLGVSGIGPRIAMGALSGLSVRELISAISGGDVKRVSSISGLGKKTAERLIVDLRDKLSKGDVLAASAPGDEQDTDDQRLRDATLALISLGYKEMQAQKMTSAVVQRHKDDNWTVEDIIRQALAS